LNFIGIDVGKQELVAYDGKSQRSFPNTPELEEFRAFLQDLGEDVTLTFEPKSTYSRFLEMLCAKEGIPSWRLNPRILPHLREMEERRSKNDRTDCQLLFLYGEKKGKGELLSEDALSSTLMAHLSSYFLIQKARVSFHNLREALSYNPLVPGRISEKLRGLEENLRKKEKEEIAQAQEIVSSLEETQSSFRLLLTIKGVGKVLALVFLILFRKYKGASQKQLTALVGLDTTERTSGKSLRGKPRISKRGNHLIRALLYQGTLSAVRYNPQVRGIYQRLKEKGAPEKKARIAAAHKLLIIAHAIYRKGVPYDPSYSREN